MDTFPMKFFAQNVQTDIEQNRMKKIDQELKIIRNKIVDSFESSVSYHSEVQHDLLPELTEDEQKGFYCMIKEELSQRGFAVRGKCTNGQLSLIIFSNAPRTTEMDRVLKQYGGDPVSSRSRSSSIDRSKPTQTKPKVQSLPTTTIHRPIVTKPVVYQPPIKLPITLPPLKPRVNTASGKPPIANQPQMRVRSNSVQGRSEQKSITTDTKTFKSKIPLIQPSTARGVGSSAGKVLTKTVSAPSTPLSTSSKLVRKNTEVPAAIETTDDTMHTSTSENTLAYHNHHHHHHNHHHHNHRHNEIDPIEKEGSIGKEGSVVDMNTTGSELNMKFIMEKLKKANEKRIEKNKANV